MAEFQMNTAERQRRLIQAIRQYNDVTGSNLSYIETWRTFKGLLKNLSVAEILEVIQSIWGNPVFMLTVPADPRWKSMALREEAVNFIRRIQQRHPQLPPMIVPPAPAAAARPVHARAPQIDMTTGHVSDDVPIESVEKLFVEMERFKECPICFGDRRKVHKWTYKCDHKACSICMEEYIINALSYSQPPVKCPGGCGNSIEPRLIIDTLAVVTNSLTQMDERIIRFISLQLASIHSIDRDTASEVNTCPLCRAVVVGRLTKDSSVARCTNPFCASLICVNCKTPWHFESGCKDHSKVDEESLQVLKSTKNCPRCGRVTSHYRNHACHHLRCPCGYEWCYECSESWSLHVVGGAKEHCPLFCTEKCHCGLCPECKPGKKCSLCGESGCPACRVIPQHPVHQ